MWGARDWRAKTVDELPGHDYAKKEEAVKLATALFGKEADKAKRIGRAEATTYPANRLLALASTHLLRGDFTSPMAVEEYLTGFLEGLGLDPETEISTGGKRGELLGPPKDAAEEIFSAPSAFKTVSCAITQDES